MSFEIKACGLMWRRDKVHWRKGLLGSSEDGCNAIDFSKQVGVYALYGDGEIVYVGQAGALWMKSDKFRKGRPMLDRLREHTKDRHGDHWTHFSWFGLCRVGRDGKLEPPALDNWPWPIADKDWQRLQFSVDHLEGLLVGVLKPILLARHRAPDLGEVGYTRVSEFNPTGATPGRLVRYIQC